MGFFDDIVSDQVAPPWLQQGAYGRGPGVGGRYLQTIGIELDTIETRAKQAAVVSMPGVGDPSALPFLGLDRVIAQGASEPNAAFVVRLSGAFDAWRIAGSDWGVLTEVLSLFVGFTNGVPPGRIVSNTSLWSYYGAAPNLAVPPLHTQLMANWNWDGNAEWRGLVSGAIPWWRYWLILDSFGGSQWTTSEGNWGDPGNWGDATASWGLSVPPGIFNSIRSVLRAWQAAHAWCRWVVVSLQAGQYTPDGLNSPDGHWGFWGKVVSGVRVQSRDTTARYVDGVSDGS